MYPQYAVARWLKAQINLKENYYKTDSTDAGTIGFGRVYPDDLWKIRYRVGNMISEKAPPYRRAIVEWKQPEWDADRLPDIGYVPVAP